VPIDTEAVSEKDAKQGQQWAEEYDFDAILSTDGDADRPLLGDEQGHWLRGDVVGILCAQYLAAKAVATPVNSNTALDQCGQFTVLRTRIGSPYVIAGMAELLAQGHQPVVGFEANGGFLVASRLQRQAGYLLPLATRDALLPMLALLAMAKERGCKVSQLADSLPPRFTASDRVAEVAPETSQAILASLLSEDSAIVKLLMSDSGVVSVIDQTDGVRLSFENGDIVHFRASGNAPELRCYAESVSQERTEALVRKALMASAG
jgi:phosphomannomutase